MDFSEKSNNQIIMLMKEMEQQHEALKIKMLNDYEALVTIEKDYALAGAELQRRLNTTNK